MELQDIVQIVRVIFLFSLPNLLEPTAVLCSLREAALLGNEVLKQDMALLHDLHCVLLDGPRGVRSISELVP